MESLFNNLDLVLYFTLGTMCLVGLSTACVIIFVGVFTREENEDFFDAVKREFSHEFDGEGK